MENYSWFLRSIQKYKLIDTLNIEYVNDEQIYEKVSVPS